MKKWFNNRKLYVIGSIVGAVAGFLYWQQIGCSSGTCMITSKPVNSTVYGALMGALILSLFKREDKKQSLKDEDKNL